MLNGCGSGWGGCACDDYACQLLIIDRQPASAPESTIEWDGNALALVDRPDRSAPPDGTCFANLERQNANTPLGQSPPDVSQNIFASCTSGGVSLVFGAQLGDIRSLPPGSEMIEVGGHDTDPDREGNTLHLKGRLYIDESVGTATSFPAMVSPDFRKVLRLHVWSGPTASDEEPDVTAWLRFVLTADDFHGYPDATCQLCAC